MQETSYQQHSNSLCLQFINCAKTLKRVLSRFFLGAITLPALALLNCQFEVFSKSENVFDSERSVFCAVLYCASTA